MRAQLSLTATELLDGIDSGELDPAELFETQASFAREVDAELDSFVTFAVDPAPSPGGLTGVGAGPTVASASIGPRKYARLPYAAKDIFATAELQSTAGSRILEGYVPPYDATAIRLLSEQGCGLIGKTNLDEFAMGSSGESSAYGKPRNPWHRDYVPGGSSAGSAAAVAALQTPMALGTDTGGSVRQPASFCGVVGYRPTYGTVSRSGLIAYSSSCDQAGVFARSSLDCALAMNTLSVPDPLDSTCVPPADVDYFAEAQREVHWEKLRVGVLTPLFDTARIDGRIVDSVNRAVRVMTDAGAQVVELDSPLIDLALPAYYIITAAECSSNLARYDGIRFGARASRALCDRDGRASADGTSALQPSLLSQYLSTRSAGFGSEVKRRILLGTYVLSAGYAGAYYDNARKVRRDIRDAVLAMFQQVDVIVTPTSPTLAFRFGARSEDPLTMYLADLCTVFVNLFGGCGISLPCGFAKDEHGVSLPIGIQLVAPPFRDSLLLRLAAQYEKLAEWKYQPPEWIAQRL